MLVKDLKISVGTLVMVIGLLASGLGSFYALAKDIEKNSDKIDVVEKRSVADSNRIRQIKQDQIRAEEQRKAIKEQQRRDSQKLDQILRELQR